jgi:putative glutamine amidotransferase
VKKDSKIMTVKNNRSKEGKPVIITNLDHDDTSDMLLISHHYLIALARAGAVPVCLPPCLDKRDIPSVLKQCDGVLFIGGKDYDPRLWGDERQKENVIISKTRQDFDISFARYALDMGQPLLGICGGHQLINIVAGGTLYSALETQYPGALYHWGFTDPRQNNHHRVTVDPTGRLFAGLASSELEVNSFHHQAVKAVGKGLRVVAHAPDGIIEALEGTASPVYTVQWHPEKELDNPVQQALFTKFVSICREYR